MLVSLRLTLLLYSVAHVLVLSDTHRVQPMFDDAVVGGWRGWGVSVGAGFTAPWCEQGFTVTPQCAASVVSTVHQTLGQHALAARVALTTIQHINYSSTNCRFISFVLPKSSIFGHLKYRWKSYNEDRVCTVVCPTILLLLWKTCDKRGFLILNQPIPS